MQAGKAQRDLVKASIYGISYEPEIPVAPRLVNARAARLPQRVACTGVWFGLQELGVEVAVDFCVDMRSPQPRLRGSL
jgi:hypothetical protein